MVRDKNWDKVKLGTIVDFKGGGTPSKSNKSYWGGEIHWASVKDIKGDFLESTESKITEKGVKNSSTKICQVDDLILVTRISPGKSFISKIETAINQDLKIVKPTSDISKRYLHYFFKSKIKEIEKKSSGTTVLGINLTELRNISLKLPPLPTQYRIVEKIEELFSDLDNGIENLKKAKQQLESYKQAILKAAFEGKLTKNWREQQDNLPTPAELKQQIEKERKQYREQQLKEWQEEVKQWEEDGEPGRKPRKPRKIAKVSPIEPKDLKQLPSIPKSWNWARIGEIGKVGTGSTPLKKKKSAYYDGGKVPWVTSGALNNWYVRKASDFVTKKALEETNLTVYSKHTLLVAMYGEGKTRGKCSELLIEACTNQAVAAIVQEETEAKTKPFLKYFFLKNYNEIRRKSSGGVQPNLNLGIIRATLVPLPPLREQDQIVEELESRLSIVRQIEKTVTNELQKSKALRQSILKKAFEGKLVQ